MNLFITIKNGGVGGQVKVWTQPSDRQNVSATNWNVNPSPFISVVADDFTVGPVSSVTAQQGRSQGFTVPLGVLGNFVGTVSFACVSPGGVTIACSGPVTLSAGASPSAVFSVTPGATTASGNITITATSGTLSHALVIPLTVTSAPPPPAVTFSGSQTLTTNPNGSAIFSLVVTGINGWTAPVTVSTYPADALDDFCPIVNGQCVTDRINGNIVTVTPPAVVNYRVNDHGGVAGRTVFYVPYINSTVPPRSSGVTFTMTTVGGAVTPSFTLTAPTQITVPAGGTATAIVSLTGQNGFSGTIQPAANSTAKFPADQTFTVTPAAPTVTALATFTAGANTEGVFTDQFTAVDPASGFFVEYDVQVTVATEP